MILYWKIRYLDRNDRTIKDRYLSLATETLDATTKAAVEFVCESTRSSRSEREIIRFRHLFHETDHDSLKLQIESSGEMRGVGPSDYCEDEVGNEISFQEMGRVVTGNPTLVLVPSGARQHDIDWMLAEDKPIPVAEVTLNTEDIRILGYFVRDLQELQDSALMRDGPGTISSGGHFRPLPNGDYRLATPATDDEIRSFVTIFRRLYMTSEPANFPKAVEVFARSMVDHPLGKWVRGAAGEYESHLQAIPEYCSMMQGLTVTFSVKRLIDVFIYTQYAHQPNEARQRQFLECVQQVGQKRNFLTWLFLTELCHCAHEIGCAGRVVAGWFKRYCNHHGITPDVLNSLRHEHTGLGTAEKEIDRKARLFREKVEELELSLWKQAGKPEGSPVQFRHLAQEQLKQALNCEEEL